jgi:hypothetical protein
MWNPYVHTLPFGLHAAIPVSMLAHRTPAWKMETSE